MEKYSVTDLLDQVAAVLPVNQPVYLVGGAVRDMLLGREVHDLDFVLAGNVLSTARRTADALQGAYYPLDTERGTGRVVLFQQDGSRRVLDFASFRGPDLEADLRARDFTVNAIAVQLRPGQTTPDPYSNRPAGAPPQFGDFIDPLNGALDLRSRVLRVCSPASFQTDPVRVLRAIRLGTAFRFRIEPDTLHLLREAVPALSQVSAERVREELMRILDGAQPALGLRLLDSVGVVPVVLPELAPLHGETQSPPHTEDVWGHTLEVIQRLESVLSVLSGGYIERLAANLALGEVSLRLGRYREQITAHLAEEILPGRTVRALLFWAALYHDTGKPAARSEDESGQIRFLGHEQISARLAAERADGLRMSRGESERLETIVLHHMRPLLLSQTGETPSRRAIYRFFRDTGPAGVDICLLSLADVLGTYGTELPQEIWALHVLTVRALLEAWWDKAEETVAPAPLLNGSDLLNHFHLRPGRLIGELLEKLREAQAVGEIDTREQALDLVARLLAEQKE